ncbi:hypothetical protein [Methylobacterium sp. Leaf112]|uniref:hypothetical protein n=1 Tax=Methylobacterium sp. Leaf112 TaxID=1736258 RepID=UPI000B222BD6|nr:hypothetical protein [Methylobacterium sp. Leaf112]
MSVGERQYLLTLAALLREGLLADPVPAYAPTAHPRGMPFGWRMVWGRIHA